MNRIFFLLVVITTLFFTACTPKIDLPQPSAGSANFTKTIALGGDFMAGYQNDALFQKGQQLSIPALLANQFKLVGGGGFLQALMPDNSGLGVNSKTWQSWFVTASHLGYKTDCMGATSFFPLNDTLSLSDAAPYLVGTSGNSIQNLAVPLANLADYFNPALGHTFSAQNPNPYYNRIASNPGTSTIFSDAKQQSPSFILSWLGMEDIYNYARSGGMRGSIPSTAIFSNHLDSIFGSLTAGGAKGAIATIPDFRVFPYYTLITWNNAVMRQDQADSLNQIYWPIGYTHINFKQGANGFIINDSAAMGGIRQLHNGEYLTLSIPTDSLKCLKYGLIINTIYGGYVLDSGEVVAIDAAINAYNAVIVQKAAQYNLALVDMYAYFNSVKTGIKWDGADFNADFVSGGFFSLDGYHPNQKGYALIANEFIKAINTKYNAVIPTVNCVECDGILFP